MNSLSWVLYLADVVGNVFTLLGLFLCLTLGVICIYVVCSYISDADNPNDDDRLARNRKWRRNAFLTLPLPAIVAIILVAIPSKTTIYMIAGSQAAERVVTSSDGQEMLGLVKNRIKTFLSQPD